MAKPEKTPFTEEQIKEIETLSGYGLTIPQLAQFYSIGKATFERRMKYSPGAVEAIEKGRVKAIAAVTQSAYQMAISKKVPSMTMFWLKCRARWRENPDADAERKQANFTVIQRVQGGTVVGETILQSEENE